MSMFLRRLFVGLLCLVLYSGAGWLPLAGSGGGGGCSQYTALAARMDGGQNVSAVQTLICGMVTDGNWAGMDLFNIYAINSTANAVLNWASSSFNQTINGSCTFTANAGFTGDGSSCYLSSGYQPGTSAGSYALNTASFGGCDLTSRTTGSNTQITGVDIAYIVALNSSSTPYEINGGTFPSASNSNAQGSWMVSRTSSTAVSLYKNGSSVASISDASNHVPTGPAGAYVLAYNPNGVVTNFTTDQIASVFYGGGLTSGQVTSIYNRLHTYFGAVGAPSGC